MANAGRADASAEPASDQRDCPDVGQRRLHLVERDGPVGAALQGYVDGTGQRGVSVGIGDRKLLVDRLAGDRVAEEIILVFTVQQGVEVSRAILMDDRRQKALRAT